MASYTKLLSKLYKKGKAFDFFFIIILILGFSNMLVFRFITLPKRTNILVVFIIMSYLSVGLQVFSLIMELQYPNLSFIYYSFLYISLFYYLLSKSLKHTNLFKRVQDNYNVDLREIFGNPFTTWAAAVSKAAPLAQKLTVGVSVSIYSTTKFGYYLDGQALILPIQGLEACTPKTKELILGMKYSMLDTHVNWFNPSFRIDPSKVSLHQFVGILEECDSELVTKHGHGNTSYSQYVNEVSNKVKHFYLKER
jgi:hypothetical protein